MKNLNLCPRCKVPLVSHEEVHAINGELYCSKRCAVASIMDEILLNAKEMAIEEYDSKAEVVSVHDVLGEDLQTVEVVVACMKRIKLPKNLAEAEAIAEAKSLYDSGLVVVEPDDCDEVIITCELVKDENSEHTED